MSIKFIGFADLDNCKHIRKENAKLSLASQQTVNIMIKNRGPKHKERPTLINLSIMRNLITILIPSPQHFIKVFEKHLLAEFQKLYEYLFNRNPDKPSEAGEQDFILNLQEASYVYEPEFYSMLKLLRPLAGR